MKGRTPRVHLELVRVPASSPESLLLSCLEKLVLGRIVKLVPASDAGAQAQKFLDGLNKRTKNATANDAAADVADLDDSWRFPNKAYTALCHRALMLSSNRDAAMAAGAPGGGSVVPETEPGEMVDQYNLTELMELAFAVDEIGGAATWRWVLRALEGECGRGGGNGDVGDEDEEEEELDEEGVDIDDSGDPDRDDAIHVLKTYLPGVLSDEEEEEGFGDAEAGAGGGGSAVAAREGAVSGSKLKKIALLLQEHKERCDSAESEFSAVVFVSTRTLAKAAPEMLEAEPALKPFLKAQHIVGLSEMTLDKQHAALESLRKGPANVLVSTPVCGERIDVPACALVLCASLANSGTALVQLRGRILCEENCRCGWVCGAMPPLLHRCGLIFCLFVCFRAASGIVTGRHIHVLARLLSRFCVRRVMYLM